MILRVTQWFEASEQRRTWILSVLCAVILCARFQQGLLHAELWGDDGWTFYPNAYYAGARCLLWPVNGYLNTVQRLGALVVIWAHVPLLWVPTLFAIIGLSVQLSVAVFILSKRLEPLWPSWKSRAAFALLYTALPNSFETFGTLTNSQWHLSLLAFLIVVSAPVARYAWRVFDVAVLILSGLSGPFCLLLVPFCFVVLRQNSGNREEKGELFIRSLCVGGCALVQGAFILHGHTARHLAVGAKPLALGATPYLLARIFSYRVVMGLLFGMRSIARIGSMVWWEAGWPAVPIAVAAAVVSAIAFLRGSYLFRAFSVFAAMLFAVELMSPLVSATTDQWPAMLAPFAGQRYFLAPMLAFLGALFTLASQRTRIERFAGITGLALVCCVGVPADFVYMHMSITHYDAKAREFDAAPAGTRIVFPEHPDGDNVMVLVKKGP